MLFRAAGPRLPVKRHPAFQDLSRDHFTALNRSLQVVRAVDGHASALPFPEAFAGFRQLWVQDGLQAHFGEEETDLLPVLRGRGRDDLAERLQKEHDALRGQFSALDPARPDEAAATAKALTAHARWEEDVVFQWLQDNLSESDLQQLLRKSQQFRAANGLPVNPPRV